MQLTKCLAFLKTVETGSISRAAEQLGYTQSAVSRMILDLEKDWGVELLHRNRAGVQLTSAGLQLLPAIRSVAEGCAELEYAVGELHGIHTGLVRVGTFTTVADSWIPELLQNFRKLYPGVSFDLLNSESYGEIEDWIRHGKVDCGFVRLPSAGDLQTWFLKRDMLMAVLPPTHPLAQAERFPVANLEGESVIKLKKDQEIGQFLERLPAAAAAHCAVSSDHTILAMVERGLGVSVLHSVMADSCRYRVVWKRLDVDQYRDIAIATARNSRLSGAAKRFVEFVCESLNPKKP